MCKGFVFSHNSFKQNDRLGQKNHDLQPSQLRCADNFHATVTWYFAAMFRIVVPIRLRSSGWLNHLSMITPTKDPVLKIWGDAHAHR